MTSFCLWILHKIFRKLKNVEKNNENWVYTAAQDITEAATSGVLSWRPATLLKKTPKQVFSCKICEILKNNYFEEHLLTTVSDNFLDFPELRPWKNSFFFKIYCV